MTVMAPGSLLKRTWVIHGYDISMGDHDNRDGSSIAAEEDMDEQESTSHDDDSSIQTST